MNILHFIHGLNKLSQKTMNLYTPLPISYSTTPISRERKFYQMIESMIGVEFWQVNKIT